MNEGLLIRVYKGAISNLKPLAGCGRRKIIYIRVGLGVGSGSGPGSGIAPPGPRRPAALSPARSGG